MGRLAGWMSEGYETRAAVRDDIDRVEELLEFLLGEAYDKLSASERKRLEGEPLCCKGWLFYSYISMIGCCFRYCRLYQSQVKLQPS